MLPYMSANTLISISTKNFNSISPVILPGEIGMRFSGWLDQTVGGSVLLEQFYPIS